MERANSGNSASEASSAKKTTSAYGAGGVSAWLIAGVAVSFFPVSCGDSEVPRPGLGSTVGADAGSGAGVDASDASVIEGADGGGGDGTVAVETRILRIHYVPGAGQNVEDWSLHYFGAAVDQGAEWAKGPHFIATSSVSGYVDIELQHPESSLGFFPTLFPAGGGGQDPIKDVETEVLFDRATPHPTEVGVRECWIRQGRPVSFAPISASASAEPYQIASAGDFIDLGDGRIRFMFRVNPRSSGTLSVWSSADKRDLREYAYAPSSDINDKGLVVDLKDIAADWAADKDFGYAITTTLKANTGNSGNTGNDDVTDTTADLSLRPVSFSTPSTNAEWARSAVFYQLMVRTFADGGRAKTSTLTPASDATGIDVSAKDGIGDLVGLRNKLGYLRELGITALWITPIFKATSFHNYDTLDYFDIDPAYGTQKDFKDLMLAAHCQRDDGSTIPDCARINLILDFVQNHTSNTTPWFVSALDPSDPEHAKYADWFVWADDYTNMFDGIHPWSPGDRLWHCRAMGGDYRCYHKIFWSGTPELNLRNPAVRNMMKEVTRFWVENFDVDGFRLDASKHIDQFDEIHGIPTELHGTHVWWKEFNAFVKGLRTTEYPILLSGENRWDDVSAQNRIVAGNIEAVSDVSAFDAVTGTWKVNAFAGDMDSQFDFSYRTALNRFLTGADYTAATFETPTLVGYVNALSSDLLRPNSDPGLDPGSDAYRRRHFFARFLSNHDVDRPASMFAGEPRPVVDGRLRLAAATVLTMPGTPVIYYGEEYGKFGRNDGGDSFIREPMEWVKTVAFQDVAGHREIDIQGDGMEDMCVGINPFDPTIKFIESDDGVSVEEQRGVSGSLLSFYQNLIRIRHTHPIFTDPATTLSEEVVSNDLYVFRLENKGLDVPVVFVAMNRSTTDAVPLSMAGVDLVSGDSETSFEMAPLTVRIIKP
ncbi:MAG: hypothetical protein H6729_09860 [Deltaproteobacteria bacterium]|nr:hypothetical protein [Deltaproteobacteria bacterium]